MFGIFKRVAELERRVDWLYKQAVQATFSDKLDELHIGRTVLGFPVTKTPKSRRKAVKLPKNFGKLEVEKKKTKPVCHFKVGDKVEHIGTGKIDTVKAVPGMKTYDAKHFIDSQLGFLLVKDGWHYQKYWKHVPKKKRGRPRKAK